MNNNRADKLVDYPFNKLRILLDGLSPPADLQPLKLSIGEPKHFPVQLIRSLDEHQESWSNYPSLDGTPKFREAVSNWCQRRFGLSGSLLSEPRTILPVAGTREALFLFAQAVVPQPSVPQPDFGEGALPPLVVIPNPYYAGYPGAAIMAGAEPLFLTGAGKRNSLPDLSSLSPETLNRVCLAYICSPSNPVGEAASLEYLIETIKIARKHNIVLAIDECSIDLYNYDPVPSGLQACESLGEGLDNVVVFQSLSKRSSAAGLRSGAVIGDPKLLQKFWNVRCFGGATVPEPVLAASADLWNDDIHVAETRAEIALRFDLAEEILNGRFEYYRPDAGFFLWLNVGDGERAAKLLWEEAGIEVMPGSFLARDLGEGNPCQEFIRIALVHKPNVVEDALYRIVEIL